MAPSDWLCSAPKVRRHLRRNTGANPMPIRAIDLADVQAIFDTAEVERLAQIVRLPVGADLARFGGNLQQAARNYVKEAAEPSQNEQRREIQGLSRLLIQYGTAAGRKNVRPEAQVGKLAELGEQLAGAVVAMTPAVRRSLEARGAVMDNRRRTPANRLMRDLPSADELRDPAVREQAVDHLWRLVAVGGNWAGGRNRPTGRRSQTRKTVLHAPVASHGEPRREAERSLVIWLQVAVSEAAGKLSRTADPRKPGPFARFVSEVLQLVGAVGPANAIGVAVEIINGLNRERLKRDAKTRPCHP